MRLDISKFKKLKTEKDHTVLQHPDGHSIKVMHAPLSPDVKEQLEALPHHTGHQENPKLEQSHVKSEKPKMMAKGGEDQALKPSQRADNFNKARARGAGIIHEQLKGAENYADGGPVLPIKKENYGESLSNVAGSTTPLAGDQPDANKKFVKNFADGGSANYGNSMSNTASNSSNTAGSKPDAANQFASAFKAKGGPIGPTPGQYHFHFYADGGQSSMAQSPADAFQQSAGQDQAPQAQAPIQEVSATPEAPMAPPVVDPNAPPTGTLPEQATQDVEAQNKAEAAGAQNVQQQQAAEAGIFGKEAKGEQDIRAKYEAIGNDLHHKFDTVSNDVAAAKIDPQHWWNSKSTGSQIATAIGMLFAGAGAGVSGHPEMASAAIDNAVKMDIDSQKHNLENKQNLLSKYMDMYHSLPQAEAAARLTMEAGIEGQIKQQAARLGSQNAMLQAQQTIAARRQALLPQMEGLAKGQVMGQMYNQMGGPQQQPSDAEQAYQSRMANMRVLNPDLGKDMENKYLPGVGVSRVPVPDKLREELVARKDLSDKLAQLENFSKEHSGTVLDQATKREGTTLARNAQDSYRRANAQGVFREAEKDFVEKSIASDPTVFLSKYRTMPGYATTRKLNDQTVNQFYKGYGIKPFEGRTSEVSGQTAMKDGVKYVKVPGGWKKAQ